MGKLLSLRYLKKIPCDDLSAYTHLCCANILNNKKLRHANRKISYNNAICLNFLKY